MTRSGSFLALGLLLPAVAAAQGTKMSGSLVCDAPAKEVAIPVDGWADRAYGVSQVKCTWTKPWQIAGVAAKDGVGTGTAQVVGATSVSSGTYVDTMANGDKAYYMYSFVAELKEGKPDKINSHKWELVGGTGKLSAAKGHGTCVVTKQGEGKFAYDCIGEHK